MLFEVGGLRLRQDPKQILLEQFRFVTLGSNGHEEPLVWMAIGATKPRTPI
jgi:hypothetical protein